MVGCLAQLLYSRLKMCKNIGAEYAKSKHQHLLANPVAVRLGLEDPQGPSVILNQMFATLQGRDIGDSNFVYIYLLEACEKLFDNEMDLTTFEEQMRWFFGTKVRFEFHFFGKPRCGSFFGMRVRDSLADVLACPFVAIFGTPCVSHSLTTCTRWTKLSLR